MKGKGKVIIISAPSGCGKTTVTRELLRKFPSLVYSVSTTTRPLRAGEKEGIDYFFVGKDEFKKKIDEGFFLEWALVHNNYYGTSKNFIESNILAGKSCVLDIDVKGSLKIKDLYSDGILIFLMPKSLKALEERLRNRKTDTEESINLRLKNAKAEMEMKNIYDHVIVNDKLKDTIDKISKILVDKIEGLV